MVRLLPFVATLTVGVFAFGVCAATEKPAPEEPTEEAVVDDVPELDDTDEIIDDFGLAHRQRIYEASRLEKSRALLYTAALPGWGNFYAEQYAVGTISMMALLFSGMFLGYGIVNDHPDLVGLGIATGGLTYATSGVFAYLGVQNYNANLRRSLHIDNPQGALFSAREPDDDGLLLQLHVSF